MAGKRHTRAKTGCLTCRMRRKKCDEERPRCGNCVQHQRVCRGVGYDIPPMGSDHGEASNPEVGKQDTSGMAIHSDRERCARLLQKMNNFTNSSVATSSELATLLNTTGLEKVAGEHCGSFGPDSSVELPFRCIYGYNIQIGSRVQIQAGCRIVDSSTVSIEDDVRIDYGVLLTCTSGPTRLQHYRTSDKIPHGITIGQGAWIGAGCIILPGVRIGCTAVVGPGTVVDRDVPAGKAANGNPMTLSKDKPFLAEWRYGIE